ncbi:hybrid sensor histidine kinase/response regulator [Desulfuribacillus alkaliarsenatis]|uniref:histidine kinase n=1 Tax=Desulfuribacillus alkaliarsenatis TaxID=766136 RepID=A0A1E5G0Z3_9FIRM|nr:ATP-binding protein [Desulfuribacillus alkaliarsenatis]OEF96576.1 hypothetical protein BHF68_07985 [Desulfuribacillus alkaliarsenatis]
MYHQKKLENNSYYFILSIGIFVIFVLSMFISIDESGQPQAERGTLDLSGWNLEQEGIIQLNGYWEFYPRKLYEPTDFTIQESFNKEYKYVPSGWHFLDEFGNNSPFGYATYRLNVINLQENEQLGLKVMGIRYSYKVFVDGVEVLASGHPSTSRKDYEMKNIPKQAIFTPKQDSVEIVIQAANFDYISSGIGIPIYFGHAQDILLKTKRNIFLETAGAAFFLVLGICYISIYWMARRDLNYFYAGSAFLIFSVLISMYGQSIFVQMFPDVNFNLYLKVKMAVTFIVIPFIMNYMRTVLSEWKYSKIFYIPIILFGGYCLSIIILPTHYYFLAFSFIMPLVIAFLIITWIIALYHERRGFYGKLSKNEMRFIVIILQIISLMCLDAILYYYSMKNNNYFGIAATLFLALVISIFLAYNYFRAYLTMEDQTKQLKKADKMKDDFLFRTSHELITPLHGIISISETLLQDKKNELTPNLEERLELIQSTSYRLVNLVNDILDFARIKEGYLHIVMAKIDIRNIVNIISEIFNHSLVRKGNQLSVNINADAHCILADENRVFQVLANLVNNSLKNTTQGIIRISSEVQGEKIIVYVEDNGVGIPLHEQEHILLPYVQGESNMGSKGLGLGLSISKELMELMGGALSLEWSEEGKGTCFRLEFQAPSTQDSPAQEAHKMIINGDEIEKRSLDSTKITKNYKVLVVDDEELNVEVHSSLLKADGYEVYEAFSGEEALQLLENNKLDIILLDVMLPKMSGYDVCRKIRENYSILELPILFNSVRSRPEDVAAGLAVGGNDFIIKPYDSGELKARVQTLLLMKQLYVDAMRNEMAYRQSQIKPHFVYNALNSITSLCYVDGEKAAELLANFSKYLRIIFTLDHSNVMISVEQEIDLINAYIEIEKVRYGNRLKVKTSIDEHLMSCKILPLIIEPLVENAILHGISKKDKGGEVILSISLHGDKIKIQIKDNGIGMSNEKIEESLNNNLSSDGIGINNINERLKMIEDSSLIIDSKKGKGTNITMYFPLIY